MPISLFPVLSEKSSNTFLDSVLHTIYSKTSKEWSSLEEKYFLSVFNETLRSVSAYKKFLSEQNISTEAIKKYSSFCNLPSVTKKNYLRAYPWKELCKNNALTNASLVMTSTSGSTGDPFYFPRTKMIDMQAAVYHQMFLQSSAIKKKNSILVIDCFGMGVWIGGLITYQAFKHIGEQGQPLTIITPGINKREIFQALRTIGRTYDTIILCGYPPFIKDVIDDAEEAGVIWSDYSLKIIFAAESFSETFREYIVEKASLKNIYRDTMNIYGSADLGTMAEETPLSILLRRLALQNKNLYLRMFGQATRLPTLAQYVPSFIGFESLDNSIACTGDSALPLVRYEIGDNGGVFTYNDVVAMCKEEGIDIKKEIQKAGIVDTIAELPFVHVYERSDFSASFYGALIYPEYIKKGLSHKDLSPHVTGKFTMYTKNDEQENQYLEINIEIKKNQKTSPALRKTILKLVHSVLMEQSAEYKKITEALGERAQPVLVFWPHGHETHFAGGAKQKWVKKIVK
jgi:phenylacetate-CoA ligase